MSHDDPFADAQQETRERPSAPNDFWKPTSPEYLVGKLDRIEEGGQYGEIAIFLTPVLFRAADHKPIASPKVVKVGLSSKTLEGLFHGSDQGSYFRIQFTGWSTQSGGRMREFQVTKLDPEKTAARLDAIQAEHPASDLPF